MWYSTPDYRIYSGHEPRDSSHAERSDHRDVADEIIDILVHRRLTKAAAVDALLTTLAALMMETTQRTPLEEQLEPLPTHDAGHNKPRTETTYMKGITCLSDEEKAFALNMIRDRAKHS
jgi:hypothetical protein